MLILLCSRGTQTEACDRREEIANYCLLRSPSVSCGAAPKLCSAGIWRWRWHLIDTLSAEEPDRCYPNANCAIVEIRRKAAVRLGSKGAIAGTSHHVRF